MIYVSTACLKRNQVGDVLKEYGENDIRYIELSGGTHYYNDIEKDLKKYREMYDLTYACHAYFPPPKDDFVVNLASCNEKIYKQSIEHYEKCIDMLNRNHIDVLSIHAGFLVEVTTETIGKKIVNPIIYDEQEAYLRFTEAYRHISKLCSDCNIDFYLENNVLSRENYQEFYNHNYFMMTDYSSIMKMKEKMNFNLLLDLAHLYVSSSTLNLSYDIQCEKLLPYAKWLHVSENNGVVDQHRQLVKESNITGKLYKLNNKDINITLETIGDVSEIKNSINIVENNERRN